MTGAYYNEIDPYAAQWLRNLIAAGHIAAGEVDERSICDVKPEDIRDFTQCHFFAGIGVWPHALRLAQWPDARAVWTGSCPCQPFSLAGKSAGVLDERHLWPHWFWLIEQCRPAVVFGEQVEAAIGHGWLDLVHSDLEGLGYAVGRAGIPAAGVGAPHIRQRLWFVADAGRERRQSDRLDLGAAPCDGGREARQQRVRPDAGTGHVDGGLADDHGQRRLQDARAELHDAQHHAESRGELGDAADARPQGRDESRQRADAQRAAAERDGAAGELVHTGMHDRAGRSGEAHGDGAIQFDRPGAAGGFWSAADWIACRDGKARPVEPGTFPLAHGAAARVGRLRAYGNAIVPQVAAQVIATFMEYRP